MTKKRGQTYREALTEIEEIITEIESESIDVDVLTVKVRRAAELIEFCKEKLMKTEADVARVLEGFEKEIRKEKNDDELF